jgi:hypothetical protein
MDEKCGKAWKRAAIIAGKNYPGASDERKGAIAAKIAKDITGEKEAVERIVSRFLEEGGPWMVWYDSSEDQYRITTKRLGFPAKLLRSGFSTKEEAVKFARDRDDGLAVSVEESIDETRRGGKFGLGEGAGQTKWKPRPGTGYCDCTDSGCPVHKGANNCQKKATTTVYRIDMKDETGTDMCGGCASDALDSGVFRSEEN